jgi:hypothetical protein
LKRTGFADRDAIPWGILDFAVRVQQCRVLVVTRERRG